MSEHDERDSESALPELDAVEEARLAALLRNAFRPSEIDPARHERLLLAALEDPLAEPSPEELVESERLRRALEGQGDHQDLRLARALSAAFAPELTRPLPEPELGRKSSGKSSGRVLYYRFGGVAAALAVAAAVLLRLSPNKSAPPAPDLATLALAQSRSTAVFFRAESAGAPSERIDRIASVRSRELRDNRYALWGVR
ncbi:MAG TPA: hypothetical protein VFK05_34480 [Polyangiaceae bacterium]|nr:hypothetical protein [Polyangiaceae bacterium]